MESPCKPQMQVCVCVYVCVCFGGGGVIQFHNAIPILLFFKGFII